MGKRWWGSGILFFCAAALVWCWRDTLLDTVLAARAHLVLSSLLLLLLYMLKGLTAAVPLSALEAVGGMLFPLPGALALNTAGVALAQAGPYWMGRLRQTDLAALTARFPGSRRFCVPVPGRGAPSSCCGWAAPRRESWSVWPWAPPASPGGPTCCPDFWGACPGWRPPPFWAPPCPRGTPADGFPWPAARC